MCRAKNNLPKNRASPRKNVRNVERCKSPSSSSEEEKLVCGLSNSVGDEQFWRAEVRVAGKAVDCRVDTGANCSVMSATQLRRVTNQKPQAVTTKIGSFFGHVSKAEGRIMLPVAHGNQSTDVQFYIVKREVPTTISATPLRND